MKVICSNAGGNECQDCKHNKPHDAIIEKDKAIHAGFCVCAINGGGGDRVQCYSV